MGYACALAVLLLVLVFLFTLLQWRLGGRGIKAQY
jgi:ABC-type sugar transport system permease subunit